MISNCDYFVTVTRTHLFYVHKYQYTLTQLLVNCAVFNKKIKTLLKASFFRHFTRANILALTSSTVCHENNVKHEENYPKKFHDVPIKAFWFFNL